MVGLKAGLARKSSARKNAGCSFLGVKPTHYFEKKLIKPGLLFWIK